MRIPWLFILPLALAIGCKQPVDSGTSANNPAGGAGTAKANVVAETKTPAPSVGDAAPEIEGVDLAGTNFKLSEYRGKVVVLDFWGDW
jgi:hypothetical protein